MTKQGNQIKNYLMLVIVQKTEALNGWLTEYYNVNNKTCNNEKDIESKREDLENISDRINEARCSLDTAKEIDREIKAILGGVL